MTAQIIKFGSRRRLGEAAKPTATCEGALPVAQGAKRCRLPRRRPKSHKALRELQEQAGTFESCMLWLKQLAAKSPDPRAIGALIDEYWDFAVFTSQGDIDAMLAFVEAVLAERRKHLPLELV